MAESKRQSLLCPNCGKLVSKDEARCPYCGLSRPGSALKSAILTRGFLGPGQLIRTLIFVNVGMYIISLLLNPFASKMNMNPFTFLSPADNSLLLLGATGTVPIDRFHRWWTLITANYLHGGVLHILFNMFALRQIGPLVLHEYGINRFFIIYTLSGAVGFLVSYFAGVQFTIGASAAVCGLIGAALYYGKSRGGVYGQAIYRQIGGWAIAIFVFGLLAQGINNWGHGGGMVAGAALGFLMGYREKSRENFFHNVLASACIIITALALLWAIVSSFYLRFSM